MRPLSSRASTSLVRHWLAGCNATWTSLLRSEGLQQRYTQATRPTSLYRFTSTNACSRHSKRCWMRPLQRESYAQVLKPTTCYEQSQPYAGDLTTKSPSMREEWSNCWWMACATERVRESTSPKTRCRRSISPAKSLSQREFPTLQRVEPRLHSGSGTFQANLCMSAVNARLAGVISSGLLRRQSGARRRHSSPIGNSISVALVVPDFRKRIASQISALDALNELCWALV